MSGFAAEDEHQPLAVLDQVGQLTKHVGVDLLRVGQNVLPGFLEISLDEGPVVDEPQRSDVADPISELQQLRPAASALHDAHQELRHWFHRVTSTAQHTHLHYIVYLTDDRFTY